MFFVLAALAESTVYKFKSEKIPKGTVYTHYFETSQADLVFKMEISKCENPPCVTEILAFEELRRKTMLSASTNYQPQCCKAGENCTEGRIVINPSAAVIQRFVQDVTSDDIIIGETANKKDREDVARISSKTLWTVIVANCYDGDLELDGTISVRRTSGYLDDRLHGFSIVSVGEFVGGLFFIIFYILTVFQTVPKLTLQHKIILIIGVTYAGDGLFKILTFYTWNAKDTPSLWAVWCSAFSRACLICGVFYLLTLGLQHPQEVPLKFFAAGVIPMTFATFVDNMGIVNFGSRGSGTWLFGYSHIPSIEILCVLTGSIALTVYAQIFKPSETSHNEKHHTLLATFASLLAGTGVVMFSLFVWRFNKNLIQTRKSEWVPFSISPIYYFFLLVVDAWFWLEFNPTGWQTLESIAHEPFCRIEERGSGFEGAPYFPNPFAEKEPPDPFANEPEEV